MYATTAFIGMSFDEETRNTSLMSLSDTNPEEEASGHLSICQVAALSVALFGEQLTVEQAEVEIITNGIVVEPAKLVSFFVLPVETPENHLNIAVDIEAWLNKMKGFTNVDFEQDLEGFVAAHYDRLKPFTTSQEFNKYVPTLLASMMLLNLNRGAEMVMIDVGFCEETNQSTTTICCYSNGGDAVELFEGFMNLDISTVMGDDMIGTDFSNVH